MAIIEQLLIKKNSLKNEKNECCPIVDTNNIFLYFCALNESSLSIRRANTDRDQGKSLESSNESGSSRVKPSWCQACKLSGGLSGTS